MAVRNTVLRRSELTNRVWERIAPLLPENGRRGKQWKDHRTVVCRNPLVYAPAPLLQDFAYSYRVWITLIKLLYALLGHLKIDPDIHQGERLCRGLLPSVLRVSEKNSSRKLADQEPSPNLHVPSLGHWFYHYFRELLFPIPEFLDMVVRYAK